MAEHTSLGRRVARVVAFAVGGGVALTLALSSTASADEVVVQDADVVNAGAAAANSGGNAAVANVSDNTATTNQTADGGLLLGVASNNAGTSNQSDGTASVTTGTATASGSVADTGVTQDVATGDDAGLTVAVQDATVVDAGAAAANSGLNLALGNASDNSATTTQTADGGIVAANNANTSNSSDGTASITTGAATATGSSSETDIAQSATTGSGGAVAVLVQDSDVINAGAALANSGLNFAFGNLSDNEATTDQTASGLLAFNVADTSNSSDGTATITTGAATATGNLSNTSIGQTIDTSGDPPGLAVVVQNDLVLDLGAALANSGLNFPVANNATNTTTVVQAAMGLIAFNLSTGGNVSDGLAAILTGAATANGNIAATEVEQIVI